MQQKLKIPVIGFEYDITREEMIRKNIRSVSNKYGTRLKINLVPY